MGRGERHCLNARDGSWLNKSIENLESRHHFQLFTDFYGERSEGKKEGILKKKVNAMTLSRQGGGGNIIHVPGNIPGTHVCPVTWEPERRTEAIIPHSV